VTVRVGNEGAGTVVAAGSSPEAQALLGRTVAASGGAMYSQYRCVPAAQCLPLFLQKVGPEVTQQLQRRVVAGLKTTFASHYTREISLAGALRLEAIAAYGRRTTGEKYLINPSRDG
jgi:NADPH:quinone reductase-like Zn-dependent oxidoreductase